MLWRRGRGFVAYVVYADRSVDYDWHLFVSDSYTGLILSFLVDDLD